MLLLGISRKRNIYGKIYLILYIELFGSLERDIGDGKPVGIAIDSATGVWHGTDGGCPVALCKLERCGNLEVRGVGTLSVCLVVASGEHGVPLYGQRAEVVANVALEHVVGLAVLVDEVPACRSVVAAAEPEVGNANVEASCAVAYRQVQFPRIGG